MTARPRRPASAGTLISILEADAEDRLRSYLAAIGALLGDKRRRENFALYACGLFGDGDRKSVEPLAARVSGSPREVDAMHRKLLRFVADSTWDDHPVRLHAARHALEQMQTHGAVQHWIIDDTGFLKQGKLSPGVQRQYTGSAGKTANCQIGVSLTLATQHAHLPVDMELYLPESWAQDRKRCRAAKIPDHVDYRPKWKIALDMIASAVVAGLPRGVVLADADYGNKSKFRDGLHDLGLQYAVAIQKTTAVRRVQGSGAARVVGERQSVEDLAFELGARDIRRVTWRESTKGQLSAKFACVRVQPASRKGKESPEQWLVIEWPNDSHLPTKYALATLPRSISNKRLIRTLKARWRTERAYQDLKGQLGLDHYEGRSYRGWNHHVTVVLCCSAFLAAEQARSFSPSRVQDFSRPSQADAEQRAA